jgi:ankyrin repeat protein
MAQNFLYKNLGLRVVYRILLPRTLSKRRFFPVLLVLMACVLSVNADHARAIIAADAPAPVTLEYAIEHSSIATVQHLIDDGAVLTPELCERAGARDALAHYIFDYLTRLTYALRRDVPVRLPQHINRAFSRQDIYTCMSALMLHVIDIHLVRELLLNGADVRYQDRDGHTALFYAQRSDRPDLTRVLIHEDPVVYDQLLQHVQQHTLSESWLYAHFKGLNRMNINRPFSELGWRPVLLFAVENNDYEATRLLLAVDALHRQEALKLALQHGSKKLIRLLMRRGACVSAIEDALSYVRSYNPNADEIIPWLSSFYSQRRVAALSTATKKALCPMP